ncbi:MAG: hypothetical protein Q8R08_02775 [bacterium]|nr:hypothetical protein [bacterium]
MKGYVVPDASEARLEFLKELVRLCEKPAAEKKDRQLILQIAGGVGLTGDLAYFHADARTGDLCFTDGKGSFGKTNICFVVAFATQE